MSGSTSVRDRARGLFVGLAVGDLVGSKLTPPPAELAATYEESGFVPAIDGPSGAPDGRSARDELTQHTQSAIMLASHLLAHEGVIREGELAAELAEWAPGVPDLDEQSRTVLAAGQEQDWRSARLVISPAAAGCAPMTRAAPIAIAAPSRSRAMQLARRQCEVTHLDDTVVDATAVIVSALWDAVGGYTTPLPVLADRARTYVVRDAVADAMQPSAPVLTGEAISVLTAALWSVYGGDGFEGALRRATSLRCVTPAASALAGALAGARCGQRAIRPAVTKSRDGLTIAPDDERWEMLGSLAERLVSLREP